QPEQGGAGDQGIFEHRHGIQFFQHDTPFRRAPGFCGINNTILQCNNNLLRRKKATSEHYVGLRPTRGNAELPYINN
ncbi:MAG TPA: hypothetical protein VF480_02025, partial [Verrucomicrobiae bacterium]